MTMLLAVNGWNPEPWLERFRRLAPDLPVVAATEPYDPAAIRYVACWKPKPGLIASLPGVEVIFNLGAGVDALLTDPTLPPVPIVRIVNDDLTSRMRDYVVLHVLYHHRQMHRLAEAQRRHDWVDFYQPPPERVRVGILGFGTLGQAAGRALAHLGFQVAGWSRSGAEIAGVEAFAGLAELPAFLARTDILVVLLPLTADTRGLIDAKLLSSLAQDGPLGGAVLINAGRGGLQVEADIRAALDAGTLVSATLDVFEQEPLAKDSPLWDHPRVIVTPHNAADSDPDALAGYVVAQIRRHERGETVENVVDRTKGY